MSHFFHGCSVSFVGLPHFMLIKDGSLLKNIPLDELPVLK